MDVKKYQRSDISNAFVRREWIKVRETGAVIGMVVQTSKGVIVHACKTPGDFRTDEIGNFSDMKKARDALVAHYEKNFEG